jgi:hypothetical protein
MKIRILAAIVLSLALTFTAHAQVPGVINYQGRVSVNGTNFNGTGQFEFALVSGGTNASVQATASVGSFDASQGIAAITVTVGGSGYTSVPSITIADSTGTGAVAVAYIGGGMVTNIAVTADGAGYTSPTIIIAAPPSNIVYTTYWSNDGSSVAGSQTVSAVSLTVTKGLYAVLLGDTTISNMTVAVPASTFANSTVNLRVWFNDGVSGFEQLAPDQRLAAAGYALQAQNAAVAAVANSVLPSSLVQGSALNIGFGNTANGLYASIAGGSNNIASGPDSSVGGGVNNAIQVDGGFSVIGGGQSNQDSSGWSVISGGFGNVVPSGLLGATIGGGYQNTNGGNYATVAGGDQNTIQSNADRSAIGGGINNTIQSGSAYSVIAGGDQNTIKASAGDSFIGGGYNNTVQTNSGFSAIVGGVSNAILYNAYLSAMGGGVLNIIQTNAYESAIGGGGLNTIQANAPFSTIGGGGGNTIQTNADHAAIGGGANNLAGGTGSVVGGGSHNTANGSYAMVGGGVSNTASGFGSTIPGGGLNGASGTNSFAGGTAALATNDGAFVWADDSSTSPFASTSNNQFGVRAAGGVEFFSNAGATTGVILAPGAGSWSSASDRNLKAHFAAVNAEAILQALVAIPVDSWSYKAQDERIRHIGPMAQDFKAAFGVGEDDRHISEVDAQGIAFAAIQGLNQKLEEQVKGKDTEIQELRRQNDALASRLAALEAKMEKVSEQVGQSQSAATPAATIRGQGGM